jgi:hypothetical protein
MLGMLMSAYDEEKIPTEAWVFYVLSPVLFPIVIGIIINESSQINTKPKDDA